MTAPDAVRILLTRIANEGALPFSLAPTREAQDAWFVTKVREAMNELPPPIVDKEVSSRFAA